MNDQGFLSKWFELTLLDKIVDVVERYLNRRFEREQELRVCGLVTRKKLMEDLDIKDDTLKRWETLGLKRFQPPIDNAKTIFYKETDIEKFLSM